VIGLTLGEFSQYSYQLNKTAQLLIYFTKKEIQEDEVLFFYPKNLLSDEENDVQQIIIGTNQNKIWLFRIIEEKCKIELFNTADIRKIEYEHDVETENVKLTTIFKSDESIVMDSVADGNRSWEYKYKNEVERIFKILSTS